MAYVSDVAVFRIFATFSAMMGLIPFAKTQSNQLIYTHKSLFGIWCLIIKCASILALFIILPLLMLLQGKQPSHFPKMSNTVESLLNFCHSLLFGSTYLITLGFIPKSIQLYNKFLAYNNTYRITCCYNKNNMSYKLMILVLLVVEPLLNIYFLLEKLDTLETMGFSYDTFQVVDLRLSRTGTKLIFALWIFFTSYPIVYSLYAILLFCQMIQKRMYQIRQTLSASTQKVQKRYCM